MTTFAGKVIRWTVYPLWYFIF